MKVLMETTTRTFIFIFVKVKNYSSNENNQMLHFLNYSPHVRLQTSPLPKSWPYPAMVLTLQGNCLFFPERG
jgi:hypothetical protein